ncbi:MAG: GDP-L-fucose synthase [Pseudomonadota bacterium]
MLFQLSGKRVWVAGHRGMVGSALVRRLAQEDCTVLTVDRTELDLTERADVQRWMEANRPDAVFVAAAKVGGILANDTFPVQFLLDNLLISTAITTSAHEAGVEKLLFLGSSCIYPKLAPQPIREDALLTGPLEPTNEWYAIAKIAWIKQAQAYRRQYGCDFISAMPTNLYGPGDNFDLASSHVMPALLRKVHEAKRSGSPVVVWGTGTPRREFMYVDDCADACVFLMQHYSDAEHVNIGVGDDISIMELTRLVMEVIGYDGEVVTDQTKPDGTPRKLMDNTKLTNLGWQAKTGLREGIALAYAAFLAGEGRGLQG